MVARLGRSRHAAVGRRRARRARLPLPAQLGGQQHDLDPAHPFGITTLPYGSFTIGGPARVGVAIGERVLDLGAAATALLPARADLFAAGTLDGFTETGSIQPLTMADRNLSDIEERLGVRLVEQPVPASEDDGLLGWECPLTICADESFHVASDIGALTGRYGAVNIKLDKAGGFTEALACLAAARAAGFSRSPRDHRARRRSNAGGDEIDRGPD